MEDSLWLAPWGKFRRKKSGEPEALGRQNGLFVKSRCTEVWVSEFGASGGATEFQFSDSFRQGVVRSAGFVSLTFHRGVGVGRAAGVHIAAQAWPEGYVGHPFIATFATYLRAPYDGVYR